MLYRRTMRYEAVANSKQFFLAFSSWFQDTFRESRAGQVLREGAESVLSKNNIIGAKSWRTLTSRIRYNRFKNLAGGDTDDFLYENGVRRAVNWNWNGDGWNANAYRVDHPYEWDVGNHAVSRNIAFLPCFWREFFVAPSSIRRACDLFLQAVPKDRHIFLWEQACSPTQVEERI